MTARKFKVWDRVHECWLNTVTLSLSRDGRIIGVNDDEGFGYLLPHIDIVQYIGRKDKRGKEIYEKDVVSATLKSGTIIVGVVNYCADNACYCIDDHLFYAIRDIVRIGNTCENPESV